MDDYFNGFPNFSESSKIPVYHGEENEIKNIVAQINPDTIIDSLNHALKGEYYDKDTEQWITMPNGNPLVNDSCRGFIISYLDGLLTNNTTMANIDEKRLSFIMDSVIETITKNFTTRLEEFGFVPPSPTFNKGIYQNKGTPDTAKMTMVANMIYKVSFLVFTRALRGQESIRIFKSLSMTDTMGYGLERKKGWLGKLFGRE